MVVTYVFQSLTHIIFLARVMQQCGCTKPRGRNLRAVPLGLEDRRVATPLVGGWELARLLTTVPASLSSKGQEGTITAWLCSAIPLAVEQKQMYHITRRGPIRRGGEGEGEPIWAVKYRDEQWADSFALCQNLLENHETPLRQASSFISSFHFFLFFFYPSHSFMIITCRK